MPVKYDLYEIKVFMFLANKQGQYLFIDNTHPDSIIPGLISPPSGHMEIGETLEETALREVKEELSIEKLEDIQLRGLANVEGFKESPIFMLITSATVPDNQTPKENQEGTPVWISPTDLGNYKTFADIESFIKLLAKYPAGQIFHVVTKFVDKKLISMQVS